MTAGLDFPIPKYRKGDKVWNAYTTYRQGTHDCPDCLGTKVWSCTSPAGITMDMDCPRCERGYGNRQGLDLSYTKVSWAVRELTIGSIKIDTDEVGPYREPVSYMCEETGIGSGSVWGESKLYATKEEADAAMAIEAALAQTNIDAQPEAIERRELALKPYFNCVEDVLAKQVKARFQADKEKEFIALCGEGDYQPGEWGAHAESWDTSGESYEVSALLPDGNSVKVAQVRGSDSYAFYPDLKYLVGTTRLLAAAPALLTALKRITNEIVNGIAGPTDSTIAAAQEAIALTVINQQENTDES